MIKKKKIKKEKPPCLATLLEEVMEKMGYDFYNKIVEAIDDAKMEWYYDGGRDGYYQHKDD